ncbi:MAG: hypothetical protein Q7J44_10780 [Pseudotabrizicola sp.]|uniref:hypothetical protein n=1 Tax=Pseudotabrizicola sp. TaxID=2939647 RepID=UPI0027269678|nr:hypothetical protein [Pseudotabrizicola sp.]MDO9639016.1 hypothetical protein [Pseudotabrizicola sp.]
MAFGISPIGASQSAFIAWAAVTMVVCGVIGLIAAYAMYCQGRETQAAIIMSACVVMIVVAVSVLNK